MTKGKMNELLGRIVSSPDPVAPQETPKDSHATEESPSSAKARINVLVPASLDGKLRGLSEKEGLTLSEIVNEALRTFINAYENKYGDIPPREQKRSHKSNRIYDLS